MKEQRHGQMKSGMIMYKHYKTAWLADKRGFPFNVQRDILNSYFIKHFHDYTELSIVFRGTAHHIVENDENFFNPGDVCVIPPGIRHSLRNCVSLDITNICFTQDILKIFRNETRAMEGFKALFSEKKSVQDSDRKNSMFRLNLDTLHLAENYVNGMIQELKLCKEGFQSDVLGSFQRLVVLLCRNYGTEDSKQQLGNVSGLTRAVSYLESNYLEHIHFGKLTEISGFSKVHFIRLFKFHFLMTPREYVIQLRLNHARDLLRKTDLSVTDIAFRSGFKDSNFFSRLFNNRVRMTPSAYRRTNTRN